MRATGSDAYLEKHYKDFNTAREDAMLTSKSDKLAEFLKPAVQPKKESRTAAGAADPALKAKVAKYRGCRIPGRVPWGDRAIPRGQGQVGAAAGLRPAA